MHLRTSLKGLAAVLHDLRALSDTAAHQVSKNDTEGYLCLLFHKTLGEAMAQAAMVPVVINTVAITEVMQHPAMVGEHLWQQLVGKPYMALTQPSLATRWTTVLDWLDTLVNAAKAVGHDGFVQWGKLQGMLDSLPVDGPWGADVLPALFVVWQTTLDVVVSVEVYLVEMAKAMTAFLDRRVANTESALRSKWSMRPDLGV
jgi:hypothetical protein